MAPPFLYMRGKYGWGLTEKNSDAKRTMGGMAYRKEKRRGDCCTQQEGKERLNWVFVLQFWAIVGRKE